MRPEDCANLDLLVQLLREAGYSHDRSDALSLALHEAVQRRIGAYRVTECVDCGVGLPVQAAGRPRLRCPDCSYTHKLERQRVNVPKNRQRPEVRARKRALDREYEQRPEVKARRREYRARNAQSPSDLEQE